MSDRPEAATTAPAESGAVRSLYSERLAARRTEAERCALTRQRLGNLRLGVFGLGILALWPVFAGAVHAAWLALPVVGFAWLVFRHDRARNEERRAVRAAEFYERGIARLDGEFAGQGRSGLEYVEAEHVYAEHVGAFGRGSLFELLSQAQTRSGELTLAAWLGRPASLAEVRRRQVAVAELAPRLDLREDLATLGPEVRAGLHPDELISWGEADNDLPLDARRWIALGLAALAVATLTVTIVAFEHVRLGPLAGVIALEMVLALPLRRRVSAVLAAVRQPSRDLRLFGELLARLEREPFEATLLVELRTALDDAELAPSQQIEALARLIRTLEWRGNQLFAPLAPLLLWGTQFAYAIEAWRSRRGNRLRGWIEAVGALEALLDLASHAYEHPGDCVPELVEAAAPRFEARALGHPLVPSASFVRNDVQLTADQPLWVISGSNMSGKSTLLRSIGTNTVLALAGGTARAESLTLTALQVGASIRVLDSLEDGISRFYAEVRCLKRVVDAAPGPPPLLFLLDEIFSGTNSHDRRIGAVEVVRGLVERGAIGAITTHDLALTRIVDELGSRARNVHFEDQMEDGRMSFDYRLREGVVKKSNALALMRAVGLEV